MYLITDETAEHMRVGDLATARKFAEDLARAGRLGVCVWLRTHTCEAKTTIEWEEHAKGLSGNGS